MASVLGTESIVAELSEALGLNKWNLTTAKYNGCTFATFAPNVFNTNDIANAFKNGEYLAKQFFGSSNSNQNDILFSTSLGLMNMTDTQEFKVVRKNLPYANGDNLEYQGSGGWTMTMVAIFIGSDYKVAYNNFLNAVHNPPPSEMFKLVHPVNGLIKGRAILSKISARSEANMRYAIVLDLTFEIESSQAWDQTTDNTTQIANKAITSILQTINAIGLGIALAGIITK